MTRSWPNIAITGTPGTGKSTHCEQIVGQLPTLRHLNIGTLVKEHGFHQGWDSEYQTYDVDEDPLLDYIEPLTGRNAPEPLNRGNDDDDDDDYDDDDGDDDDDYDNDDDDDDDDSGDESGAENDQKDMAREGVRESDDVGEDRGGLLLDWHCCEAYPLRWVDLVVVLRCDHQLLWRRLEKRNYPLFKIKDNNEAEIMDFVLTEAREAYPAEAVVELRSESIDDVEQNVTRIVEWIVAWRAQHGFPAGPSIEGRAPLS